MTPVANQTQTPFETLRGHQYINLTTFRKTGQPVSTPVWFAQDGARLFVTTQGQSGKVKRIRNNGCVQVAPSDVRGKPLGPDQPARARLLPATESDRAHKLLLKKYGWQARLFMALGRLRGVKDRVYLEITPEE